MPETYKNPGVADKVAAILWSNRLLRQVDALEAVNAPLTDGLAEVLLSVAAGPSNMARLFFCKAEGQRGTLEGAATRYTALNKGASLQGRGSESLR